jgi:hypothetical protein
VTSIAIESYVVPDRAPSAPPGFALLSTSVASGVPCEIDLADGWSVVVHVPTGTARAWLDADPAAIVTSSDLELQSYDPAHPPISTAPARLVVRRGGAPLAAVPLTAGMCTFVTSPGSPGALEVIPLAWDVRAGALLVGARSSIRLELAWRTQFGAITDQG